MNRFMFIAASTLAFGAIGSLPLIGWRLANIDRPLDVVLSTDTAVGCMNLAGAVAVVGAVGAIATSKDGGKASA